MKKIGIIVQYYTFRNDLRLFIEVLSKKYKLYLFVKKEEYISETDLPKGVQQIIIQSYRSSLKNKIWNMLYRLFGNQPKNEKNKLNWNKRRFSSSSKSVKDYTELVFGYLAYLMPNLISFDKYISYLGYNKTPLHDLQTILSFTDVNDVYFYAQLIQTNKKIVSYVYSWDHPGKYFKFSKSKINYLTWNKELKKDLTFLHKVEGKNIQSIGSTQLCLLYEAKKQDSNSNYNFEYIYFGASAAYSKIASQELEFALFICKCLYKIDNKIKFLFRPYPNLKNWELYKPLQEQANVVFENYRNPNKKVVFSQKDLQVKFTNMRHALAIFHCGSTFGMEAAYFDSPVFCINFNNLPSAKSISKINYINQYYDQHHLKKYLALESFENYVLDAQTFPELLHRLVKNPEQFLGYNKKIASYTPLQSAEQIIKNMQAYL